MTRILLAADFFHPVLGGAERQVQLLATALQGRGHDVHVATIRQPGQAGEDLVDGVAIRRLPALSAHVPGTADRRFVPPLPDPVLVPALRRLYDELRPEVVNANGWIAYSCAAALEGNPAPLVLSVRDYGYSCATRSLLWHDRVTCDGPSLGKCLDCAGRHYGAPRALIAVAGVMTGRPLLRRHVRGIHSVSRFVERIVRRDLLRDAGDAGDAGVVALPSAWHHGPREGWEPVLERIPDIVPASLAAAPAPEDAGRLEALPHEPFILFVGALQPYKGLNVLLAAYELLRAGRVPLAQPVPPLVVIGVRHPDTPSFPDGITVIESAPHAVVMAAWERSLFGVAPSIWPDPLPGVVREPMTRGRPVVATEVGGNPDMVTSGVNGLLVPAGDARALAEAMACLIDDRELRERLGRNARDSVSEFTPDGVAARFESFYDRVMAA